MPETEGVVWEEYHDRSAGLMIFGLIQVGLGVLAVLFCALIGFSVVASGVFGGGMPAETMRALIPTYVLSALMLVAIAVLLTTLGAGSIMARRWARTLSLALWSMVLAYGVVMCITWVFSIGSFGLMMEQSMKAEMERAAAAGQRAAAPPPGLASFMMIFMMVFTALFGIGLPLPFVLFYRSKHVKATCEWRDPVPRWTDTRPVPVIVAAFLMFMAATMAVQQAASNSFYIGVPLTGVAAMVAALALLAVFVTAVVGLLKMRLWGWGLATAAIAFEAAIWLYAAVVGKTDIFDTSLYNVGNLAASTAVPEFLGHTLWTMAIGFLLLTVYFLWLKRYFRRDSAAAPAA